MFAKIWRYLKLPTWLQLWVMRIFQDEFLVGVTGIFFDEKKRILLFKHTYRGGWSLPGGYVKGKEHPREGLEREILEESGLVVSVDGHLKLRTDRNHARLDITYYGTYIGGDFVKSSEVKEAKFFSFSNLPRISSDQLLFIDRARKLFKVNGDL